MIEIPLSNLPEQLFSITLNGIVYDWRVIYNSRTGIWTASISNPDETLIEGLALLPGVDLSTQHLLPITNMYMVNIELPQGCPTRENLGTGAKLFILTDEEEPGNA